MKWVITDSKYLTKPSKDWQPHIPTANTDPAYIEVTQLCLLLLFFTFVASFLEPIPSCQSTKNTLKHHFSLVCCGSSVASSLCSIKQIRRAQWWAWLCLKWPC